MRHRRRQLLTDDETENFWPSFTDLISTVSLILFVLVLLAYVQNLIAGKNLEAVKADLARTLERLRGSQQQITTSEKKLRLLAAEIEAGQARLALSEERVAQQEQVISQSNLELGELRTRLTGIAVLRLDLLKKVKQSIETQLGSSGGTPQVSIAENGNIVIDESLLFEYDSYTVKRDGQPFLDRLASAFAHVLEDPNVRDSIDVVLVQGHTDERGSTAYNRELSAKRANAVLNYMFETDKTLEQSYGSYFASSAYSEFRPINRDKNEAGYRENRRIEISIVLRDASVRSVIDTYLQNLDPSLRQPAPAAP
jgi:chemotaxis protein MotB